MPPESTDCRSLDQRQFQAQLEGAWARFVNGQHPNQMAIHQALKSMMIDTGTALRVGILNAMASDDLRLLAVLLGLPKQDSATWRSLLSDFSDPLALGELHHAGVRGNTDMPPRNYSSDEELTLIRAIGQYCLICRSGEFITAAAARQISISWLRMSQGNVSADYLFCCHNAWSESLHEAKAGEQTIRALFLWLVDRFSNGKGEFEMRKLEQSPFMHDRGKPKNRSRTFRRWIGQLVDRGWIERISDRTGVGRIHPEVLRVLISGS